jgi:primosomal replication protein N
MANQLTIRCAASTPSGQGLCAQSLNTCCQANARMPNGVWCKIGFLISGRQHHATIPLGFSGHLFGKGQSVLW